MTQLRAYFERLLETIVILLLGSLATLVVVAVVFRKAGASVVIRALSLTR